MYQRAVRGLTAGQLALLLLCAFCLGYLASDLDRPGAAAGHSSSAARGPDGGPLGSPRPRQHGQFPPATLGTHTQTWPRRQESQPVSVRSPAAPRPAALRPATPAQTAANSTGGGGRSFRVNVVIVLCGDRFGEVSTLIKSIVHFAKRSKIGFHVFADDAALPKVEDFFRTWAGAGLPWVTSTVRPLSFPEGATATWKGLFRVCASQRLFVPDLLPDVDRAIYLDTDNLLVRDIADLWDYFDAFNSSHLAAMIKEGEQLSINWYARHARHPFYGRLGLNSGVMLMDLARMRAVGAQQELVKLHGEYHAQIPWGDQDLLNIYFALHPDRMYPGIACPWNFRTDHCTYSMNCAEAALEGISLLHGNRQVFHNVAGAEGVRPINVHPVFREIYQLVEAAPLGTAISRAELDAYVAGAQTSTYCKAAAKLIVRRMLDAT